jgi:hypothetical protein
MGKLNLSEAALAILSENSKETFNANIAAKKGQRGSNKPEVGTSKLSTSVVTGQQDAGSIGDSPEEKDDGLPQYTKGTPTATPPGATPPIGSQTDGVGASTLQGQPQSTMGRSDLAHTAQSAATDYAAIRDRIAGKMPTQTFQKNPGANFQSYGEGMDMSEDVKALLDGEGLSEEFAAKATTIFEAAVMSRVTAEVARLKEEFEAKVANTVAEEIKGIVEQVDGYLGYIAEQWMTENEIALERGIKSDILESFVEGLKGLFEEHYIDVPEEQYDLLGEMQETISDLQSVLDEQVEANVKLSQTVNEAKRNEIVKEISEGLTDTQAEKLSALVEEVAYDDLESFESKVKTLRESYFTNKTTSGVSSVVTDSPVVITEAGSKNVDPKMSAYLSALNNK